MPEINIIN